MNRACFGWTLVFAWQLATAISTPSLAVAGMLCGVAILTGIQAVASYDAENQDGGGSDGRD